MEKNLEVGLTVICGGLFSGTQFSNIMNLILPSPLKESVLGLGYPNHTLLEFSQGIFLEMKYLCMDISWIFLDMDSQEPIQLMVSYPKFLYRKESASECQK